MTLRAGAERWLTARWYGTGPVWWMVPLSALYALLLGLRALLWRLGWQRPETLPVPVIVVGNLTVGGTGKTPFVAWLVGILQARGHHPGIISRGYGGTASATGRVVRPDDSAALVGDEALLHARSGVPVYIGRDRVAAARALCAAHPEVDVLVADDGLEHRRLPRVLEVLMLDGARGLGNGWWLPAGPLRGSAARLARVDLIVATGQTASAWVDAPVMRLEPGPARRLADGATAPLASFAGQPVRALAGIGNPERFFALLRSAGLGVEAHALPDHAHAADMTAALAGDAPVLMTEKDAVRLGTVTDRRLWSLPVTPRFLPHDEAWILDTVERALARRVQEA
jgi:tetraacyldisaccharide 4'-kinase